MLNKSLTLQKTAYMCIQRYLMLQKEATHAYQMSSYLDGWIKGNKINIHNCTYKH